MTCNRPSARCLFVCGWGRQAVGLTVWTGWNFSTMAWKSSCPVMFVAGWVGPFSLSLSPSFSFFFLFLSNKKPYHLALSCRTQCVQVHHFDFGITNDFAMKLYRKTGFVLWMFTQPPIQQSATPVWIVGVSRCFVEFGETYFSSDWGGCLPACYRGGPGSIRIDCMLDFGRKTVTGTNSSPSKSVLPCP